MNVLEIAQQAAAAAVDKKASRLVCLDLREASDFCDYQFVCSGESDRQTKAIAEAIEERIKKELNIRPVAVEGKQTGNWVLIDYGSVIIHVFLNIYRDYYAVETIWPKARQIPMELA